MFTSVAQANAAVIEQIRRARPHWLDVQPASSLISELNQGKTLLHAGPPMRWQEMTGPMKGACVGACLFEGWAKDEAQALLMRALAPQIARLDHDKQHIAEVMDFLSVTDQFFLNLAMAYCKAAMDAGAMIRAGSIVTAMTRNGNMFGIRVSGLGERWFTAPVNTPQGLFFTGFSQEQANPDMGDSAITETFGIGGAAMIAAPGVTRFVGAGGMEAARAVSEEMAEIFLERNMQLQIPGWDFQGACLGLDIRRVVETGITPLINTGIAHKEAGIGQIGAGTVRAPLACFEQALEALAESMGIG